MEYVLNILNETYVQTIILFATAVITLWIYFAQKRAEQRNAARIIVIQIDNINQKIDFLMRVIGTNVLSFDVDKFWQIESVVDDNEWKKYSHLFVGKLNYNEIVAMNNYFDNVISIKEQQQYIKSMTTEINTAFYVDKVNVPEDVFRAEPSMPTIRIPASYLTTMQLQYEKILNSRKVIPYERLKDIAKM